MRLFDLLTYRKKEKNNNKDSNKKKKTYHDGATSDKLINQHYKNEIRNYKLNLLTAEYLDNN